jgi:ParB family transcriptional regulator, chromosome partitioning protein
VVDVTDEDAFIMSLAENIARRGYRPLEILADIEVLRKRGYSAEIIIQKTGLSPKYVKDIVFLLDQGEERLIEGVQRGTIPLTTALEIARANQNATEGDGQANLGGKTSAGDSGLRTESKARKTWLRWFFYSAPSTQSSALIVT